MKRYEYQMEVFEQRKQKKDSSSGDSKRSRIESTSPMNDGLHIPKKGRTRGSGGGGLFCIPKKRKP